MVPDFERLRRLRSGKDGGELGPSVGGAPIDDPHLFDPRLRGLDAEESRGLVVLHAAPKLPFGHDDEMLVERIGIGGHLPPPVMTDRTADRAATTHLLC